MTTIRFMQMLLLAAPVATGSVISAQSEEGAAVQPEASAAPSHTSLLRPPLLREGSQLVEVPVTLQRDPSRGGWKVQIASTQPNTPPHELLLLPCTQLAQMLQVMQAAPNREITFQINGRVYVYRGQNYLLPTHAAVVSDAAATQPSAGAPASDAVTNADRQGASAPVAPAHEPESTPPAAAVPTEGPATASGSDSVDDIMRNLEAAAGDIRRSSAANVAGTTTSPIDTGNAAPDRLMVEESAIVNRRGKIVRDAAGGWSFVFDADASGLADPPMQLLPCMLLERIEEHARRLGNNSPALLNGIVYVFGDQNYLLPTVFRIPQERRNLTP